MKWWCPHCKKVMPVYIKRGGTNTHHLYYYHCGDCHTIIGKFRKKKLTNG
jgi:phage FluMu protein Com